MKKYLVPIIISISIIILVVGIMLGKEIVNKSKYNGNIITANNKGEYSVDFNTVKKITISYMSNNKELSNVEKDNMLSKLSKINYKVVNEPALIVSTDYKIDFNNGIYFSFGNYGNEIDVYENNLKKFTTQLPKEILDSVRNKFNMDYKNNLEDENLMNKNQVEIN